MDNAQTNPLEALKVASLSSDERDKMFREVPSFPPYDEIYNGDLFSLSLSNKAPVLTHGLHRFPAKFIPRIPGWVLEQFAKENDVVLDPFCGSGTTLVEAILRSKKAIGIDYDPLACLISKAKTSNVKPERIKELGKALHSALHRTLPQPVSPMPDIKNFQHWFSNDAWAKLQAMLKVIKKLDASPAERDFILCIFSSMLRWVSNADDQTQKTYVSGTLKKHPPEVERVFSRFLVKALTGLGELASHRLSGSKATIIRGDASDIRLAPRSVDLIVTSPPYLDSVDYMYNFMLEYFWLGPLLGVKDRKTFNQMRRNVIGAKKPGSMPPRLPSCLGDLISEKDIPESRIIATRAYCANMANHFQSAARVLKLNSYYFLTIGNSQTRTGVLPLHDSLIRLAVDAGFTFEKAFAYRIRRHYMKFPRAGRGGIITMDWVIALKNTQKRGPYPARLPLPGFTLRNDEVAN